MADRPPPSGTVAPPAGPDDEAGLNLVGRGLLEGLVAGAALGSLTATALWVPAGADGTLTADAVALVPVAAAVGAVAGLVGAVLALAALGLVVRHDPRGWTTSRLRWAAPALAVGAAVALLAVDVDWWPVRMAVLPAAAVTAWRVRGAVRRYAERAGSGTRTWSSRVAGRQAT